INAAAWADPHIDLLIAHPDDRDRVSALPDHRNLRINTYGPYRNRTSVGPARLAPARVAPAVGNPARQGTHHRAER
ncbi:MAG: hypothetical protein WAK76_25915, partial [Trebonia sp.]